MSLSAVREKIDYCEEVIAEPYGDDIKTRPSREMQKNQSVFNLKELHELESSMVKELCKLYLVQSTSHLLLSELKEKGVFVADHLSVARQIADKFWPQLKPGLVVNGFIISQINEYLDDICADNKIDNFRRPRLNLVGKNMIELTNKEHFSMVIEMILEDNLKNYDEQLAGHDVQAIVNSNELLKQFRSVPVTSDTVNYVVLVPEFSKDLIDSYTKFTSKNIFTVNLDAKLDVSEVEHILNLLGHKEEKKAGRPKKK